MHLLPFCSWSAPAMQLAQRAATSGTLKLLFRHTQSSSPVFIVHLPWSLSGWVLLLGVAGSPSPSPPSSPSVVASIELCGPRDVVGPAASSVGSVVGGLIVLSSLLGSVGVPGKAVMAAGGGGGSSDEVEGGDGSSGVTSVGNICVGRICVVLDSLGGSRVPSCTRSDDGNDVGAGTMIVNALSAMSGPSFGCRAAVSFRCAATGRFSGATSRRFPASTISLPRPRPPLHIADSSTMGPHIVAHWIGMPCGGRASASTPAMSAPWESSSTPVSDGFILADFAHARILEKTKNNNNKSVYNGKHERAKRRGVHLQGVVDEETLKSTPLGMMPPPEGGTGGFTRREQGPGSRDSKSVVCGRGSPARVQGNAGLTGSSVKRLAQTRPSQAHTQPQASWVRGQLFMVITLL